MKIYNTLTKKKENLAPIEEGQVKMYVCGPTVYDYFHIGNARVFITFDAFRKYLKYRGYKVIFVQNFTDIDDKVINKAKEEGKTFQEISKKYIEEYYKDAGMLGIEKADYHPKATENITEMIEIIQTLINKGLAYEAHGDVYYRAEKFKDYGKLSKQKLEELKAGARIEIGEKKENPLDFALWKKAKPNEPSWESPWGEGRPGWHIECSAMSRKYLGDTIDIHAGGPDLIFPHHENEIAQTEGCTDKEFAKYWMHVGYLNIDNEKMSKSLGNFFTTREILKKYSPEATRFLMLSAHYRNPINFTDDLLNQADKAVQRIRNTIDHLNHLYENTINQEESKELQNKLESYKGQFIEKMDDDFNTADGISIIFEIIKYVNTNLKENSPKKDIKAALDLLAELSELLGIIGKPEEKNLEKEVEAMIEKRQKAREEKDFKTADAIRDELKNKGIVLKDTPQGVRWSKVK